MIEKPTKNMLVLKRTHETRFEDPSTCVKPNELRGSVKNEYPPVKNSIARKEITTNYKLEIIPRKKQNCRQFL